MTDSLTMLTDRRMVEQQSMSKTIFFGGERSAPNSRATAHTDAVSRVVWSVDSVGVTDLLLLYGRRSTLN